jgi:hypothetical protein
MSYSVFKKEVEKLCGIVSWTPSQKQIENIAIEICRAKPKSKSEVERIVASVCPGTTFICLEGVDNSDIRTLLALAVQVASTKR